MTKNEYMGKIKELETLTNNIAAVNNIQQGDGDIARKDPVYITTKEEYEEKFKDIWDCEESDNNFKGEGLYDAWEWEENHLSPAATVIEVYEDNIKDLMGEFYNLSWLKGSIKEVITRKNIYLQEVVDDIDEEGYPYKKINDIKIVKGEKFKGDIAALVTEDIWGKINTELIDACCDIESPLEGFLYNHCEENNIDTDEVSELLVEVKQVYKYFYEKNEIQEYIRELIEG